MAAISTYLADKLLDHSVGKTSYTMPAAVYVALMTTAVIAAGTGGVEAAYTGYARSTTSGATWNAGAANANSNAAAIAFPACTGGTSTVVQFAVYDALTGGNLMYFGTCSLAVSNGITPSFAIGALTLSMT